MANLPAIGIDTPALIAHSLIEHPNHQQARNLVGEYLAAKRTLALCPVVVDEFIHVTTDPRRFEKPLSMAKALELSQLWMQSQEVCLVAMTEDSWRLQHAWLREFRLGRKRIHDTAIAAMYHCHGVEEILTSNVRDFEIFRVLRTVNIA